MRCVWVVEESVLVDGRPNHWSVYTTHGWRDAAKAEADAMNKEHYVDMRFRVRKYVPETRRKATMGNR